MSPSRFETLLSWVAPLITKSAAKRKVISPAERLCVTLRYLVTGDAQVTIATSYRISPSAITRIIRETCEVLWNTLSQKDFLRIPREAHSWKAIAAGFEEKWNFPHCLGAIDGKHVVMQAPPRSGSDYFNYKKTHSIVLLAVCDANYIFTLVDIGDAGRQSDGGVYSNSTIGYAIDQNLLDLPKAEPITAYDKEKLYPYTFIADDAFTLKTYMIKPYSKCGISDDSQTICNYRISRARRIIENSFGILAARFRIFRRPIIANVETVTFVTKAAIALHNFLMISQCAGDTYTYCPVGFTDNESSRGRSAGQWRAEANETQGLCPLISRGSNNFSRSAKEVRDAFKDYFNSQAGAVSWQWDMIKSTVNPFDEIY